MTVAKLIEVLKEMPQDAKVAGFVALDNCEGNTYEILENDIYYNAELDLVEINADDRNPLIEENYSDF